MSKKPALATLRPDRRHGAALGARESSSVALDFGLPDGPRFSDGRRSAQRVLVEDVEVALDSRAGRDEQGWRLHAADQVLERWAGRVAREHPDGGEDEP